MARVSREQAARNRQEIEEVSARLFRERGLNGVSVSDLMGAAGLTHGGFYGHFESKDALAAVAVGRAFAQTQERWKQRVADAPTPAAALASITETFLAPRHRDEPGGGCATTALATDVGREAADKPVRQAFGEGLEGLLSTLAGLGGEDRAQAIRLFSTMVGAVVLARATAGSELSDEILEAVRAEA